MESLKTVAIQPNYTKLHHFGTATLFRASSTSCAYWACSREIDNLLNSDDVLIQYPTEWLRRSIITSMTNARHSVLQIAPQLERCIVHHQRECIAALVHHDVTPAVIVKQLCHRVRLLCDVTPDHMTMLLQLLKDSAKYIPRYLTIPFLRSVTNAWTTHRRMGDSNPCPFCDAALGSDLLHFVCCPTITRAINRMMPQPMCSLWPGVPTIEAWMGIGCPRVGFHTLLLCHDLVHTCFYEARMRNMQSFKAVAECMLARKRQVVRRAPHLIGLYKV